MIGTARRPRLAWMTLLLVAICSFGGPARSQANVLDLHCDADVFWHGSLDLTIDYDRPSLTIIKTVPVIGTRIRSTYHDDPQRDDDGFSYNGKITVQDDVLRVYVPYWPAAVISFNRISNGFYADHVYRCKQRLPGTR